MDSRLLRTIGVNESFYVGYLGVDSPLDRVEAGTAVMRSRGGSRTATAVTRSRGRDHRGGKRLPWRESDYRSGALATAVRSTRAR